VGIDIKIVVGQTYIGFFRCFLIFFFFEKTPHFLTFTGSFVRIVKAGFGVSQPHIGKIKGSISGFCFCKHCFIQIVGLFLLSLCCDSQNCRKQQTKYRDYYEYSLHDNPPNIINYNENRPSALNDGAGAGNMFFGSY
jgi:hypothetical protein